VLTVGGAAAIAAKQKLAPGPEHRYSRFGEGFGGSEQDSGTLHRGEMIAKEAFEICRQAWAVRAHATVPSREYSGSRFRRSVRVNMGEQSSTVIDRLAQASVLVIGDVLLDRFVEGRVSRISPEAPVPVLKYGAARALLGGAGNVAANLIAYGASVSLVGLTGEDSEAEELRALCGRLPQMQALLVADRSRPTTVKTRYLGGWHQLLRVDAEEIHAMDEAVAQAVLDKAAAAMKTARAVVLSDYGKGVLEGDSIAKLIAAARQAGLPVIVDPKKARADVFAGATLLTPNTEEMARFSGIRADSDESAEAACRRVLETCGIEAILLTRGEAGMTLVQRGVDEALHVRAATHRVFDVTGAGDTVIATLSAALSIGAPLAEAVRLANAAAGIAVTKPGTAVVHAGEIRQALGLDHNGSVVGREEAAARVSVWKDQGLKVGFTNGCFDLLHRGHLYSLDQASRRVDRLVVGVNSDASARGLKGPDRPVQDEATRAAVVAALRYVDLVVIFGEETPEALITALGPDVLFKGADYKEDDVAGGAVVKANGGRVELLPLLPGHSTTATVGRLRGES
jgi:D-beta-D-heptose 7-phosphate kinase / D-beta-D-heptose 1-phosphate adenosyltransferase